MSDTLIAISRYGSGLSNNEMILGDTRLDSIYQVHGIPSISGEIIKGEMRMIKNDSDDPKIQFGLEMIELYAESYDGKRFTIPNEYELVE